MNLRVLHLIAAPTLTGPADPALGLARGLKSLGIHTAIAIDTLRAGNLREKVERSGVPLVEGLGLSTTAGIAVALRDRAKLRAMAGEWDFLHAHSSHDHALAVLARGSARIVRSIHHPRSTERRGLQGFAYRRTAGFVTVATAHGRRLLESYPLIPTERVATVPGAVDCDRFHPKVDGRAFRAARGIPAEAFVVGMVSRIKPGRGHDLALEAFRRARARLEPAIDLRLAFIGKGEGVPALERAIAQLDSRDAVHLYGFRDDDLPEAIRSCDVTLLCREGNDASCRAVLESLSAGVPVIGARWPAIEDALFQSDAGVLFPIDDLAALTDALVEAARSSPGVLEAWGENGRRRVLERHTDEARALAVLGHYRRWIEAPSP